MTFCIAAARPEDIGFLQSCARASYTLYVERIGREPAPMTADFTKAVRAGTVSIVWSDQTPLGYVHFFATANHMQLENIAVHPQHQGKGLAKLLFDHVERSATMENLHAIELYTNVKMFENLTLYPKLGYIEIDRRTEDGFERVYFRKELNVGR